MKKTITAIHSKHGWGITERYTIPGNWDKDAIELFIKLKGGEIDFSLKDRIYAKMK